MGLLVSVSLGLVVLVHLAFGFGAYIQVKDWIIKVTIKEWYFQIMFSNTFTDRTNLFMQHSGRNIQCRCMDGRRKSRSRQHPDRKVIGIDLCTVVLGKHFSCHPNLPFRISGGHPNCNNGTFLLSSKYIYQRLLVPRKF